jgi:CSLREA domain-containing protein
MKILHRRWVSLGVALLVLTLGAIGLQITAFGQSSVTTILVTTPLDIISADGLCSLREAVQAANSNLPSGA